MKLSSVISTLFALLLAYSCKDGFDGKNGIRTYYFKGSNKIQCTEEYKNGKKNGPYIEYYENGNARFKTYYENDTIKDTTYAYYKNGVLSSIQIFKKGDKTGCWKKFSMEGKLYNEMCFENNALNGPAVTYTYRTGRLLERMNYKNGRKHGKQESYYNSGKPKSISYYSNDNPCIGLHEWDESGKEKNNDFKIFIDELSKVFFENKLIYTVRLDNPQPDDKVCEISDLKLDTTTAVIPYFYYRKDNGSFKTEFYVPKRGFIMKKVKIAALRKTSFGNTMVKTATYNVSATNY